MDDLISRQAAIKATWQDTGYTDPFNVMTAIRDRIQQLPSTYPESSQVPYWHSVSEIPEEDDDYLLLTYEYFKYGRFPRIIIGAWDGGGKVWLEYYEGMYRDVHPVAWISQEELLLLKGYEVTE